MTMDIGEDFAIAWEEFGVDATINYAEPPVKLIRDTDLEEEDSHIRIYRAQASTVIARRDRVAINGTVWNVIAKPAPYGDTDEEKIISLRRAK